MTNAEKFKEVFGFGVCAQTPCRDCPLSHPDKCTQVEFWQSEYQEPNVQAERQKWVDALTRIKSEFHSNYFDDEGAVEELFDEIIDKHTKELMK